MAKRLDKKKITSLLADKAAGKTLKHLAGKYGVSVSTVKNYVREYEEELMDAVDLQALDTTPGKTIEEARKIDLDRMSTLRAKLGDKAEDSLDEIIPGVSPTNKKALATTAAICIDKLEQVGSIHEDLHRRAGVKRPIAVVDAPRKVIVMKDVRKEAEEKKKLEGTNDE